MTSSPNPAFDVKMLRTTVLEMAYAGSTVHIGCAFSIIELLAVLYRNYLRYPGNNPHASDRDYLVLSKGHGVMAQYACMRELGWLPDEAFTGYFSDGSNLTGLSDSRIPGLEVTSGSLGHGFSVGVGLAMGAKLSGTGQRTFALVGDGELNEGPIWEGALFAAHNKLKNFMVIVDENGFQAMGRTDEVLGLGSIQAKFESFGFETMTVDGHDERAIDEAIVQLSSSTSNAPKALVARTVKGKGVPFMEGDNIWHYTRLNSETYEKALAAVAGGVQ
ncbi:transketolase domain-containing protein [Caballeronia sordidicola]|uniref:Transketolase domain-containing protein n=1 Tax=Caballeronia sordidicola TaxID=196367 RepID=A0A158I3F0_CABSO|nr:transketolase [Caballeronia sordidicola]SAL51165.1 transketolase domain-containing protein [Caballeronia sordidicola]